MDALATGTLTLQSNSFGYCIIPFWHMLCLPSTIWSLIHLSYLEGGHDDWEVTKIRYYYLFKVP